jgi:hypothetical protein
MPEAEIRRVLDVEDPAERQAMVTAWAAEGMDQLPAASEARIFSR